MRTRVNISKILWQRSNGLVDYLVAEEDMSSWARQMAAGAQNERVWLLEHPSLYTLGTSANAADVLTSASCPTYTTGRGGQVTYHGPGQRIAYVQLNLKQREPDLKKYIHDLESWLIATLDAFGIRGERREGRVGIWVNKAGQDVKIAAIGVRIQKWITLHGIALNVHPDLDYFKHIVPCGLSQFGVTSFADLGVKASMSQVDAALHNCFEGIFGPCAPIVTI